MTRRETVDIVKEIVENLSFSEPILEVVDNGDDTFTLRVCNTHLVQPICGTVVIDTVTYSVTAVDHNESITVSSTVAPPQTNIDISAPSFFFGTTMAVNQELSRITETSDKLPLVYLFEVFEETFTNDSNSRNDRTSPLRMFFLGPADFTNWKTADHHENAIKPMRNLAYDFIDYVTARSKEFGDVNEFRPKDHVKFGVFTDNKGHTNSLFNEKLSGVELRVNLPIRKSIACSEDCNC